jgi:hypothetical protein
MPGLFCFCRTLTRDYVPGYSLRSPLRGRAKARSACAVESRSRSQIRKPRLMPGLFGFCRTLTRDYVPGYSLRSPLRGRAKARSADAAFNQYNYRGSQSGYCSGRGRHHWCCLRPASGPQGQRAVIIDPQEPGQEASFRNAGLLETEQVFPITDLSTLEHLPAMLIDPIGPLSYEPGSIQSGFEPSRCYALDGFSPVFARLAANHRQCL